MNTARIAQAIQDTILKHNGVATKVTCPARVTVRTGFRFSCGAALAVGVYPMYVVEKATRGAVTYANHTPLRVLNSYTIERAIENAIETQKQLGSTVVCPKPVLQASGLTFTCLAKFKHGSTVFSVTQTDNLGHVRFVGR
jgi:hypothetical protein